MPLTLAQTVRFWDRVDITRSDECWIWTGYIDSGGYGRVWFQTDGQRQRFRVHRLAYELLVGPIPEELVIDHLCRVRSCCNPAHLEPVTQRENAMRGVSPSIVAHLTGVCQRGHSLDDAYLDPKTGWRTCRPCSAERWRRKDRRRRQNQNVSLNTGGDTEPGRMLRPGSPSVDGALPLGAGSTAGGADAAHDAAHAPAVGEIR